LIVLAFVFLAAAAVAEQSGMGYAAMRSESVMLPGMMAEHRGMMGMGPGGMGMDHDSRTVAEMAVIHELVLNHDRIERTVTNLPDGIRTVTESDDPTVAAWIQEHVASMVDRVDAESDPGLPMESPALRSILTNGDKVETTVETTEKGAIVTQRSTDPDTVAALQEHAAEVSDLVDGGMMAMRAAMVENGAGMPQHGMHGRMMGRRPNATAPDAQ
jgi:hypothetical protein